MVCSPSQLRNDSFRQITFTKLNQRSAYFCFGVVFVQACVLQELLDGVREVTLICDNDRRRDGAVLLVCGFLTLSFVFIQRLLEGIGRVDSWCGVAVFLVEPRAIRGGLIVISGNDRLFCLGIFVLRTFLPSVDYVLYCAFRCANFSYNRPYAQALCA